MTTVRRQIPSNEPRRSTKTTLRITCVGRNPTQRSTPFKQRIDCTRLGTRPEHLVLCVAGNQRLDRFQLEPRRAGHPGYLVVGSRNADVRIETTRGCGDEVHRNGSLIARIGSAQPGAPGLLGKFQRDFALVSES
jgi:hypothetical protein